MKKPILFFTLLLVYASALAQNVTIAPGGITPELNPLIPRLSYKAILSLPSPKTGDLAVDTTYKCMRFFNGARWLYFLMGDGTSLPSNAQKFGGPTDDAANGVAVDANGNTYITGYYTGTAVFGSQSIAEYGGGDLFVVKLNVAGDVQWVRRAGGASYLDLGNAIAVDDSANVYITGGFRGTAAFGSGNLISNTNSVDAFILKYDTNGNFKWASRTGGQLTDEAKDIVLDGNGNGYITGYFNGSFTVGSSTLTSAGGKDYFVAKFSTNTGTFISGMSGGGTADDEGKTIAFDGTNINVAGSFQGTATFGSETAASVGGTDIFLAKYSPSLVFSRKLTAGGTGNDLPTNVIYIARPFTHERVLYQGSIILTGYYGSGSISFGAATLTNAGNNDILLVKLSSAYDVVWVRGAGGTGKDEAKGLAADKNGNLYITGSSVGNAVFETMSLPSLGNSDDKIYYAKYDYTGNILAVTGPVSNISTTYGTSMCIDTNGFLSIVGYFSGSVTLGSSTVTTTANRNILRWSISENQ